MFCVLNIQGKIFAQFLKMVLAESLLTKTCFFFKPKTRLNRSNEDTLNIILQFNF